MYFPLVLIGLFSIFNQYEACSIAYNFEYLLLAVQWPESFCETARCAEHKDVWSIHGAWPQYLNGSWPQDCCFESTFQDSLLDPIKEELLKKWKTLKAGGVSDDFWAHEWEKHGTCAMSSPLLKGELNYFKNTLQAFNLLSIEKWLSAAKIVPTEQETYSVTEFHSAITKGLGFKVQIDCLAKKHNSVPIIAQINFCLNKDTLKPFDCPTVDQKCGHTSIAYLPSVKAN
jgi:ribonuclease T2